MLAEQVFESVASDVQPLVSYGSILRPVREFVRESQSPNKVAGKIALTEGYRAHAQRTGLFGTAMTINAADGLFQAA